MDIKSLIIYAVWHLIEQIAGATAGVYYLLSPLQIQNAFHHPRLAARPPDEILKRL